MFRRWEDGLFSRHSIKYLALGSCRDFRSHHYVFTRGIPLPPTCTKTGRFAQISASLCENEWLFAQIRTNLPAIPASNIPQECLFLFQLNILKLTNLRHGSLNASSKTKIFFKIDLETILRRKLFWYKGKMMPFLVFNCALIFKLMINFLSQWENHKFVLFLIEQKLLFYKKCPKENSYIWKIIRKVECTLDDHLLRNIVNSCHLYTYLQFQIRMSHLMNILLWNWMKTETWCHRFRFPILFKFILQFF